MRRSPTNPAGNDNIPAAIISGPVLPALRRRRSPERAARIATKLHLIEFVQMLETRRAELGISRSAIARQLGVTQPTISRLFSGHVQNIELRTMVRVAEVLNSDLELAIRPRSDRSGNLHAESTPGGRSRLARGGHMAVSGMSMYNSFWEAIVAHHGFREALERAASGLVCKVDVTGLADLNPEKRSWNGTVRVRRDSIIPVDHDLMAHARSVGNVLAASGMLAEWSETVFRLSINKPGTRLTVRRD